MTSLLDLPMMCYNVISELTIAWLWKENDDPLSALHPTLAASSLRLGRHRHDGGLPPYPLFSRAVRTLV